MTDVTALGEVLIDFTPCGKSPAGMNVFEQNPGGAPANVLSALARLGKRTAFIGKVGDDIHGAFLRETLIRENIDTAGLITDKDYFTTLAFVELSETGERKFSFARKPGADTQLRKEDLPADLLNSTKIFHFGSLSLTDEPARSATVAAAETAKKAGSIISYDPNYRALLWDSPETATDRMRSVLSYVDVIKISDEETVLMTGAESPEDASRILFEKGIPLVVVTLGKNGALVRTASGVWSVRPHSAKVVDTTGAGDSFWGGFLYKLLESGCRPEDVTADQAEDFLVFANAVATLCVQKRGGIPAMPRLPEVLELYKLGPANS